MVKMILVSVVSKLFLAIIQRVDVKLRVNGIMSLLYMMERNQAPKRRIKCISTEKEKR